MALDGGSPWRTIGDLTAAQFKDGIPATSPLLPEIDRIYAAVTGYSALYKAHLEHENSFATTGEALNTADHNAQGSKDHTNGGYMQFASWTDGAAWWKQHVLTYPDYQSTTSIAEYVSVYAPASDGNDEGAYINVICKYGNQVQGGPSMPKDKNGVTLNMTPGIIPLPKFTDYPIWGSADDAAAAGTPGRYSTAWDDLGQRPAIQKGIVLHRSEGTWQGNMASFGDPSFGGLTGWQVNADTGELMRFLDVRNPKQSHMTPWASGPFNKNGDAYGDGLAYEQKYGINAINRDEDAIEITGFYADPVSQAAWDTLAAFSAPMAHDYGIPWDQWPIAPQDGFSFYRWHQEICGPIEKVCPGGTVMNGTPALIEAVRTILHQYQTGTQAGAPAPTYAPKHPLPRQTFTANGTIYWYAPATLKTVTTVTPLEYGDANAAPTGAPIGPGLTVNISHVCIGSDGQMYVVGTGGSRLLASALVPAAQAA